MELFGNVTEPWQIIADDGGEKHTEPYSKRHDAARCTTWLWAAPLVALGIAWCFDMTSNPFQTGTAA